MPKRLLKGGRVVDPANGRDGTFEAFERRFGFPLVEVWGMTETGRIFSDCHEPRSIHTRASSAACRASLP